MSYGDYEPTALAVSSSLEDLRGSRPTASKIDQTIRDDVSRRRYPPDPNDSKKRSTACVA